MSEEDQDHADHLVAAARIASREGLTREQFMSCAAVFWDSWHAISAFRTPPAPTEGESER